MRSEISGRRPRLLQPWDGKSVRQYPGNGQARLASLSPAPRIGRAGYLRDSRVPVSWPQPRTDKPALADCPKSAFPSVPPAGRNPRSSHLGLERKALHRPHRFGDARRNVWRDQSSAPPSPLRGTQPPLPNREDPRRSIPNDYDPHRIDGRAARLREPKGLRLRWHPRWQHSGPQKNAECTPPVVAASSPQYII